MPDPNQPPVDPKKPPGIASSTSDEQINVESEEQQEEEN